MNDMKKGNMSLAKNLDILDTLIVIIVAQVRFLLAPHMNNIKILKM